MSGDSKDSSYNKCGVFIKTTDTFALAGIKVSWRWENKTVQQ